MYIYIYIYIYIHTYIYIYIYIHRGRREAAQALRDRLLLAARGRAVEEREGEGLPVGVYDYH